MLKPADQASRDMVESQYEFEVMAGRTPAACMKPDEPPRMPEPGVGQLCPEPEPALAYQGYRLYALVVWSFAHGNPGFSDPVFG